MNDILIAEISGKRPGGSNKRPTEKFQTKYDKVIISNNSENYVTDWPIINVPDDYRKWYCDNIKNSENAWYAPMNRSYAIKYAREHGYKYLVQLDDNIVLLEIATFTDVGGIKQRRRIRIKDSFDDFVKMFEVVLDNTNAVMTGCQLAGIGTPESRFLIERFCYSIFCLKLDSCPDVFHGDFEDDIEYRMKCYQMGLPVVQIAPLRYGKTGQQKTKDLTGCRAEYLKAGLKRGRNMSMLYPEVYSCKMTRYGHSVRSKVDDEAVNFKHTLKPLKVGVIVYDMEPIKKCFSEIIKKNADHKPDKAIIKVRKTRK